MIEKQHYYCLLCNKEYHEGEDECSCVKEILYACPVCKDSYEFETYAEHCCEAPEESTVFVCESCGDWQTEGFVCDCEEGE